ncbi:Putative protein of unknown function [Podospora comata]|uniref:SPRY domain-containing protein n=1 Tax=Podospora comata TaxID=48703 RepID=A0ABY6RTG0_PODCO|nr:Putative protein of unknown function [Podospora comata]
MCFGSKKNLYDGDDLPPRPAPGQAPQQPTYAPEPKASASSSHQAQPQQHQHQQQYNQPPPPSPLSAVQPPASWNSNNLYSQTQATPHTMPVELPDSVHNPNAPAELPANDYAPPPGPPPSHTRPAVESYAPPPGPPPSHGTGNDYAPPLGPPPPHSHGAGDDFAPPPGPPPSHGASNDYAPPPGPPLPRNDYASIPPPSAPPIPAASKPQETKHDWESVVPDTSLFPPPPAFFAAYDSSHATNATEAEAEAGEAWCRQHPLSPPIDLDHHSLEAQNNHNPRLMVPDVFKGTLQFKEHGIWAGQTDRNATDSCIIGYPPLYTVKTHSPFTSPTPEKTIYYEVAITSAANPHEICLSLGFTALPYPSFRQPGWHRGSLAVHGDDGHKFINDRWGGKDFTGPFRVGERYGIGMTFTAVAGRIETEIFFTRNGLQAGRWNLHEEGDSTDLPVTGLEGYHDLSCAVGTYGGVGFEVIFRPETWLFLPEGYYPGKRG